ncbi:MAG: hypothetical protein ABIY51_03395 [Ferruginibacter sp.]
MNREILSIIPVLPSANITKDIAWYKDKTGFETKYSDNMYAILLRDNVCVHLQWHANTERDPLLGGSVIRIVTKNIIPLFDEFMQRGTVTQNDFKVNTAWGTNEFGFFDLNKNAIFIIEDIE